MYIRMRDFHLWCLYMAPPYPKVAVYLSLYGRLYLSIHMQYRYEQLYRRLSVFPYTMPHDGSQLRSLG